MGRIELIYDADCPNVPEARELLRRVFDALELPPRWQEWRSDDPEIPEHARGYASPTIRVDGQDVSETVQIEGTAGCRVYWTNEGASCVPALEDILAALRRGP